MLICNVIIEFCVKVKMMNIKEKVNGLEERSSQFEKRANGSTVKLMMEKESVSEERIGRYKPGRPSDEKVSTLHFGDHTRTINKKEISMHETCNQEDMGTISEFGFLQEVIKRLQNQIQVLSTKSSIKQDTQIDMKLLKMARRRLKFDVNDVHASIASWNYFFKLYGVTADYDKFLAVEQLLPAYILRAFAVCGEVQAMCG